MFTPIRSTDIREHNEKLVLRLILMAGAGGISQSDIVAKTGLKAPTVFRIFSNLEQLNYIEMCEKPELPATDEPKRKGRKPVLYHIKNKTFFIIGLDFWANYLSAGIFDLSGEKLTIVSKNLKPHSAEEVVAIIVDTINTLVRQSGIKSEHVLGIGMGAPGQIDLEKRTIVHYPGIKDINNLAICDFIEDKCSIPVFIHNNCAVLGMQASERYPISESLFLMIIRRGINGVFIQNRKPFVFQNHRTIEFGHIPVFSQNERCSCGAYGCLETVIGKLDPNKDGEWLFESYFDKLDELAANTEVFSKLIDVITTSVLSIRRLFAPDKFLVMTGNKEFSQQLCDAVDAKIQMNASLFDSSDCFLVAEAYDPDNALRGASQLVIEHLLS